MPVYFIKGDGLWALRMQFRCSVLPGTPPRPQKGMVEKGVKHCALHRHSKLVFSRYDANCLRNKNWEGCIWRASSCSIFFMKISAVFLLVILDVRIKITYKENSKEKNHFCQTTKHCMSTSPEHRDSFNWYIFLKQNQQIQFFIKLNGLTPEMQWFSVPLALSGTSVRYLSWTWKQTLHWLFFLIFMCLLTYLLNLTLKSDKWRTMSYFAIRY